MAGGAEPSSSASSRKGKGRAGNDSPQHDTSETTPLLSESTVTSGYGGSSVKDAAANESPRSPPTPSSRSSSVSSSSSKRSTVVGWPSIVAGTVLAMMIVVIIIGAFFVPVAVEEYAKQAAVLEPTNLSLESITATGVRARVQANFRLDGSRVKQDASRRIGRAATWIVGTLGTDETLVSVYLPEYDNILLGTAALPPFTVNVIDGQNTAVDVITELALGDADGIRTIANTWLEGKLDTVRLVGKADISLRSGRLPLGTHGVVESIVVEANNVPTMPAYNISRLNFHDAPGSGDDRKVVGVDVTITSYNEHPIQVDVPELGFDVLVPNCNAIDPFIPVAQAVTDPIPVRPRSEVAVSVHGIIEEIPDSLTRACPDSTSSPLDQFLKGYLNGEPPNVLVRGRKVPGSGTPEWIEEILSSIAIPVPFPGRSFDDLIKNFSLTDVDFQLPDPLADPDDEDGKPTVSGTIEVLASLPSELNLDLNVTHVRATADVLYKHKKLGVLNIKEWQRAESTRIEEENGDVSLLVKSRANDVPLTITDQDVFTSVLQALLFGGRDVILDIDAAVHVKVKTVLGELVLKDVPTKGKIPVKPLPVDSLPEKLRPRVDNLRVLKTTETAIHIEAMVNITNPTPYSATIPYFTAHVVKNGTIIGDATVKNVRITTGTIENLLISIIWEPARFGEEGRKIGVDLVSGFLSDQNITLTAKAHESSIPSVPILGRALSNFDFEVSAPKLNLPSDDPDDKGRFIRDATFHLFSSTATFILVSPFRHDTLLLEWVNATAYYNHTEPVGHIDYYEPFAVRPGGTRTPRLPVDWSMGSIGYGAVRRALGGELKLDARADVTIRIGSYRETLWYVGQGIGAAIRP
ncbi:uncharacterized protein DNG_08341 [Cephalotrichum gorgonifer]|uniref:Plant heme peroxidase family profile domain-containing protein n=1 Tax=Cephalotrichum gorgonifer TaxID=2041049 RepID=A0AAE8SYA7_9PEZI|nr:uncharacterized protein DNG_08341 [Cephalotrichum gorgonifer]